MSQLASQDVSNVTSQKFQPGDGSQAPRRGRRPGGGGGEVLHAQYWARRRDGARGGGAAAAVAAETPVSDSDGPVTAEDSSVEGGTAGSRFFNGRPLGFVLEAAPAIASSRSTRSLSLSPAT